VPSRSLVEELEFDLQGALLTELVQLLDDMPTGELNDQSLASLDDVQGVYQLFKTIPSFTSARQMLKLD
jgi:hypothetical protein